MKTISDLMRLTDSLNREDLHLMLRYSGHVQNVSIDIHYDGWKRDAGSDEHTSLECYTNDEFELTKVYLQLVRANRLWAKRQKKTYFDYQNNIEKIV
ncbi:MAG: hypothetical protein AB7D96_07675 [Arcobacteraceae bacterium]